MERPARAFRLGLVMGGAGLAVAFAWLVYAIRVFGGFSLPLALLFAFAPVAWMALQLGVFAALAAWLGPVPLALGPPLVYTAVEFLFPSLFPWRLAHTQYRVPVLLQSGELAGPYLLTFAMVWVNAGLVAAGRRLVTGAPGAARALAAPLALVAALAGFGVLRLAAVEAMRARAPSLTVGIVQGNIGIERKGERALFTRNLDEYRRLSHTVAPHVDVLIWPETVVQDPLPVGRPLFASEPHPFPRPPRPLVFGGLGLSRHPDGRRRVTNAAFLVGRDGVIAAHYDKRILVPFGEYMPLGDRFPALRRLSPATSDFAAGTSPGVLPLSDTARLGPLICYEDVIPGPAREAVAAGATALLNLTNDAWYGDSAEPIQHQALAVWRTVETRRDFVRATNTGLTSVLSATGRVLAELPIFVAATLVAEIRLLEGRTFYGTYGDVFAWLLVATVAGIAVRRGGGRRARPRRRRARRPAGSDLEARFPH